jgi:hypothetical protein
LHAAKLEHEAAENRDESKRLRDQLEELRQSRKEFEEGVIVSFPSGVHDVRLTSQLRMLLDKRTKNSRPFWQREMLRISDCAISENNKVLS